jgi:DNA repair exonuclease SbcCD ATPase subunit
MLKKAKIKNFKSHEDTEVDFHEKITAFQGLSSHGKTALIRAIKLACTFRPIGSKYISHFSKNKKCEIDLEFKNGEIDFKKTKSNAEYILNKDSENPFGTLNKTVPEEVSDFIKLDEDNFIGQFDRPYLIFSEKSAISKKINETLGIEKWDTKLKEITKNINDSQKEIKRIYTNIKNKKKILKDIDTCGYSGLENLIQVKREITNKVKKYKEKNKILEKIKLQLKRNDTENIKNNIDEIENLYESFNSKVRSSQENKRILEILKIIKKWKDNKKQIDIILESGNELLKQNNKKDGLNQNIIELKNGLKAIKSIISIRSDIKEVEEKIEGIKKRYNKMETCPECGQNLIKI